MLVPTDCVTASVGGGTDVSTDDASGGDSGVCSTDAGYLIQN